MMKWFYIEKDNFWKLLIIAFAILSLLPWFFFFTYILFLAVYLFLFRRKEVNHKDSPTISKNLILSPASGKILKISENENEKIIQIVIPIWKPYGLTLPCFSIFSTVEQAGKSFCSRYQKDLSILDKSKFYLIKLENKLGVQLSVQLMRSYLSWKMSIWLQAGDRGRAGSSFGYMPFGGQVVLRLPKDINILVKSGEAVSAGKTVLAGLKG